MCYERKGNIKPLLLFNLRTTFCQESNFFLLRVHDVAHTYEERWKFTIFFFVSIHSCIVNVQFRAIFIFLYNNNENFLDGYLIAGKTFHTDILK